MGRSTLPLISTPQKCARTFIHASVRPSIRMCISIFQSKSCIFTLLDTIATPTTTNISIVVRVFKSLSLRQLHRLLAKRLLRFGYYVP